MAKLKYTKSESIVLKKHADFNEKWLQDRIVEDPTILGLGEVVVHDKERRQERAGRLDLLLSDPDDNTRYEVELMLGPTDPSHIIRTIEYWDIERRRYPAYEHIAVLVAEDVTSRFLNVLSLFSGSIPLIAIQLNALQIEDRIVLSFIKVLDQRLLRAEEDSETKEEVVDEAYWNSRAKPETVKLAGEILEIINEKADPKRKLNFTKTFIGLTDGTRSRNFITFIPRKSVLRVGFRVKDKQSWSDKFEDLDMPTSIQRRKIYVTLTRARFKENNEVLTELIYQAVKEELGDDD